MGDSVEVDMFTSLIIFTGVYLAVRAGFYGWLIMATPTDTELLRWLRNQPGRCPICGAHIRNQGHDPDCQFKTQRS